MEEKDIPVAALVRLPAVKTPLLIMRDFQPGMDMEVKRQIFRDIAENNNLRGQLRDKFGPDRKLMLTIEALDIRLLYVPELRHSYRNAYERYCHNIINYIFQKTQRVNFYRQLVSPSTPLPSAHHDGISAFLVHQLAKAYRATCCFRTDKGDVARYRFDGAFFSKRLGAVAVVINNPIQGVYEIQRKKTTIWQNRCDNLYALLQVPVEETLHYILGAYTDAKILAVLKERQDSSVSDVEKLANDWMAIEEAVVGGLTFLILKAYTKKHGIIYSPADVQLAWQAKKNLPRYKYRKSGIELVSTLGFTRAFEMYTSDPAAFIAPLTAPLISSDPSLVVF